MKSFVGICTSMLLTGTMAMAQTEGTTKSTAPELSFKSVRGHEVLPQKGDWAMGVSASSFLGYLGNMMNNSASNGAPSFSTASTPSAFGVGSLGGWAVMGKYMKSSNLAYRVRFQANTGSNTLKNAVAKDLTTPDPLNPKFVDDKMTTSSTVVLLGAGFEKRRGHGRVQGFMGAELLAGFSGSKKTYTYGNKFTSDFSSPTSTTDFYTGTAAVAAARTKESSTGNSLLFGARGFAGVEYFIAPKLSLGGELGYTLGFSTNGKGYTTTELWNPTTLKTSTVTTDKYGNAGLSSFGAGLDNINAGINLHFYF